MGPGYFNAVNDTLNNLHPLSRLIRCGVRYWGLGVRTGDAAGIRLARSCRAR